MAWTRANGSTTTIIAGNSRLAGSENPPDSNSVTTPGTFCPANSTVRPPGFDVGTVIMFSLRTNTLLAAARSDEDADACAGAPRFQGSHVPVRLLPIEVGP